ncbi:MAG: hypothetical protein Q8L69_14800, partial [Gallionellaceae bacterium]|nr:hypothetical protein [Gallionellaceae bacterium]
QAWSNTMTDWSIDPAAACNASLANSASSQAKLEQAILGDAITSIASNLNATPTTDYLANLVNSFRIGLGEEDAAIVNATEIRTLTGAQGGGEVWGGGRLLELSDGGLNEWYVFNESVYAYNVANGITSTAPSAPGNTSYNGTLGTAPYAQPGADNYDGLGILYNFNLGSNTTFLTYGSGGSTDYVCPADTTTNIWNENFSITNSPVNNLGYYGTFTGSKGSASRLIFQNHATSPTH